MFIPPTEDQRICAWFECQTEETLRDLHERFDAVSPRECWTAFFNDCPSPAPESLGDSLAAPVEVVQGVCSLPTIEQFQRWLETEAHTAHQQFSLGYGHETLKQETDRCRNAANRIANLRAAMALLLDFKAQA